MIEDVFEFLQEGVTPCHAAATAAAWLDAAGFTRLEEADYWNLEPGRGYYLVRGGSAVAAWRVPDHAIGGWRITASHSDSPGWKVKADTVEKRRLPPPERGGLRRHEHGHLAGPPADRGGPRAAAHRGRRGKRGWSTWTATCW